MTEFLAKLLVSAAFTVLIEAGMILLGRRFAWWLAALIALVVVFGGLCALDRVRPRRRVWRG